MSTVDTPKAGPSGALAQERPTLSFWQIWNMCFGFFGIQIGFALQNANMSRIFQTLGADMNQLPVLWIAAPLTGLLVQPVIGYLSDRTWTGLGRRRPFFLVGAVLASLALVVMPNAPALWIAAGTLWILDASINISMEPFRAFVADNLASRQRAFGYGMQSFFIAVGAVFASALPWLLSQAGVGSDAPPGQLPPSVIWSFYIGAAAFIGAVGWTVFTSKEYPPEALAAFDEAEGAPDLAPNPPGLVEPLSWLVLGGLLLGLITYFKLDKELYLLGGGLVVWGLARVVHASSGPGQSGMFATIMRDMDAMPLTMRQLAIVQFFSWFALFAMWIYATPAVTSHHFGALDANGARYNEGADWVGILFAGYNVAAGLAALAIPLLTRGLGLRGAHALNLILGAAGLASMQFISDPNLLLVSMVGVGFAWASIVSLPYALLADSLPSHKVGIYMGIFNFFIVIPQLVAATLLGFLLKSLAGDMPIQAFTIGAASFVLAAIACLLVSRPKG